MSNASSTKSKTARRPAKEAILQAATEEFSEKGLHGVRIEHVAERAGCNKALIYRYYGNKEALFQAVLMAQFEGRETIRQSLPDGLASRMAQWAEVTAAAPEFMRLIQWEALTDAKDTPLTAEEYRKAYYAKQVKSLQSLLSPSSAGAAFDPTFLFFSMLAIISFPATMPQITRLVTGIEADSEEFKERFAAFSKQFAALLTDGPAG